MGEKGDSGAMSNRVTIRDIADRAGVSIKTVSLALRGDRSVAPQTAASVREVAQRLGYRRFLEPSGLIGVITPRTSHPFYGEILHWLQAHILHAGLTIRVRDTDFKVAEELAAFHDFDQAQVDGVILVNPSAPINRIRRFLRPSRPIIAINTSWLAQDGLASLDADYQGGARQAAEYLIDEKHTRIAYLSGPEGSLTKRRQVYEDVLKDHGCFDYRFFVDAGESGPATFENGYSACLRLFELASVKTLPTAILAFNDLVALGAIRAIHEKGLSVPEDVSVLGFDDLDLAKFTVPKLSTVAVPRKQLASEAVKLLLHHLEGDQEVAPPERLVLPTTFIARESTAAPRAGSGTDEKNVDGHVGASRHLVS